MCLVVHVWANSVNSHQWFICLLTSACVSVCVSLLYAGMWVSVLCVCVCVSKAHLYGKWVSAWRYLVEGVRGQPTQMRPSYSVSSGCLGHGFSLRLFFSSRFVFMT